ncbi:MAG TPA: hypothetical protein DCX06_04550 [Opitutae bacterium]|nr:hypothetical protein [Opitutae bacterium]
MNETVKHLLNSLPMPRVLLALFGVFVLIMSYVLMPVEGAEAFVRLGGYWFTFLISVGTIFYVFLNRSRYVDLVQTIAPSIRYILLSYWVCLSCLMLVHTSLAPKVMMDDAVLESTARNLHESRAVYVTTYGRIIENQFNSFEGYVDKRPWLYPFVVSVVHDFTGYRVGNSYYTNVVLGILFLGLLHLIGLKISGLSGALLLPLLWITIPLLSQNATGSGMDMLNLFLIGLIIISGIQYLERPSLESEALLSLSGLLLAYARYESLIFCGLVCVLIPLGWWRAGRIYLSAASILAAPLLIGRVLQQKFFTATEALWELNQTGAEPFGLSHFTSNLAHAYAFFFSLSDELGNSYLVALLGVVAIFLVLLYMLRNASSLRRWNSVYLVVGTVSLFLLLHLFIILCYHDGDLSRLFASRFSLPFYMLLTLLIVVCLKLYESAHFCLNVVFALTLFFLVCVTMPNQAKGVFTHRNYVVRELQWIESILAEEASPRMLVVDVYGVYWALRDISALPQSMVMISADRIEAEVAAGKFSEILVIDRRDLVFEQGALSSAPIEFNLASFDLELIDQASFKPMQLTTIYRVSDLTPHFSEVLPLD